MAALKNMLGGSVDQVSWDILINMVSEDHQRRLTDMAARHDVEGVTAFRVEQMDSSAYATLHFLIYGPGCTYKTIEVLAAGRLGDVPSRFAYPFAYWSKT